MGQMKNFAEKVSTALGKEGEIDDDVCKVSDTLLSLISKWGLRVEFSEEVSVSATNYDENPFLRIPEHEDEMDDIDGIVISGKLDKKFGP